MNLRLMRMLVFSLCVLGGLLLSTIHVLAEEDAFVENSIEGVWLTKSKDQVRIDMKNNQPEGIGLDLPGVEPRKDVLNPDESLRDRFLHDVVILKDFVYQGKGRWAKGTIYDPNNGKTYQCLLRMKSDSELMVRGYIGVSLIGRTEIWTRIE